MQQTPDAGQSFRQFPPYVAQLGLRRAPFARHDADFFFPHAAFSQRLEMLLKFTAGDDLVLVSGENDAGKSTLIEHLLKHAREDWRVCRIDADPMSDPSTLLTAMLQAFEGTIEERAERSELGERLRALRARGEKPLLIVDNAHLLPERSLEQVLELSTWRDEHGALIQALLFTEPQIKSALSALPEGMRDRLVMHQLFIKPLTQEQTGEYLLHRLRVAGLDGELPLDEQELERLHRDAQGLPGRLAKEAHRALLDRALGRQNAPTPKKKKKKKTRDAAAPTRRIPLRAWGLGGLAVALTAGAAYGLLARHEAAPARDLQPLTLPEPNTAAAPPPSATVEPEPKVLLRAATPDEERRPTPTAQPAQPARTEVAEAAPPSTAASTEAAAEKGTPSAPVTIAQGTPKPAAESAPKSSADDGPRREAWFLGLPEDKYTIQLMSHESEAEVRRFIAHHRLEGEAGYLRLRYPNGTDKFTVVLGVFDWNRNAKAAIEKLPRALKAYHPWSRNVSALQKELRALQGS